MLPEQGRYWQYSSIPRHRWLLPVALQAARLYVICYGHWDSTFNRTLECEQTFKSVQSAILKAARVRDFDIHKVVVLQCDASSTGLGAVLIQEGQPVTYASRALTTTECNYCQLEQATVALVFATSRFNQYIFGLPVTLETDHKPLEVIVR